MKSLFDALKSDDINLIEECYYDWGWDTAENMSPRYEVACEEYQIFFDAGFEDAQESIR